MIDKDQFGKISDIRDNDPSSWEGKIFLTLDIDWAADFVISDVADLLTRAGVKATWFVTHDTPMLEKLRSNPNFELGIHPNFNFLLAGDGRNGKDADEVVDRVLTIVPEAQSVRSHSMTQSTNLMSLFHAKGLTFECNHFIPEHTGLDLKPWMAWNGMLKVPYFWEDDVACLYDRLDQWKTIFTRSGLRVVDFHPIHVYLNTNTMDLYEQTRSIHRDEAALLKERYVGFGVRNIFKELIGTEK